MFKSIVFVVCAIVGICAAGADTCTHMHPVVLMPGIMGTVLHGTADIPAEKSIQNGCPRKFEDQLMWIDIKEVLHYSCLKEYFSSNFNPDTGKWERLPGIEFSVPRWGSTYAVDDLVPNGGLIHISYYKQMIEKFESLGFVDGVNIFGAGFDWKESPSDKWVNDVKNLIESAYISITKPRLLLSLTVWVAHTVFTPSPRSRRRIRVG